MKGFSLIELLLVIMLIGFSVGLIVNMPNSINLIGSSRHQSLAKEIATYQLENLRLKGFDNLPGNGQNSFSDPRLSSLPGGAGSITMVDCPASVCSNGEENIKQASVSVTWKEKSDKSVTLTTLISQGGLR